MTDYSKDEDPGGPSTGSPWHFFIWKPPSLSWVFSYNDSNYNKISKPDGSNHQSLECVSQSPKQHKVESAHSIDCRGAIDGSYAPAGQHVWTRRHQYSTPTQSCTVSSESGQPWHDIVWHTQQGPQNTSASTQISHIYPSSQHDSGDLGKALDNLGNGGDQLLVGRTILPTNWRYVFTSHKHHQDLLELLDDALISLDSASFAPFARMAALLEKAILRTSFSERYIGLYPHSADPPIRTKEKIPEPPKRLNIHRPFHQRPVRSKKHQLHSQPSSTRSLLVYLLQLARAFTSIFIAFPLSYRVVYHNKTPNTKKPHLEVYIDKMDLPYIYEQMDPTWLKNFAEESIPDYLLFDTDQFQDIPATYNHSIITQSTPIPLDIDPTYPNLYSYPLGYPLQSYPAQLSPYSEDSPMDQMMDCPEFDDFVNMPSPSPLPAPTPAPVEVEDHIQLQSDDTNSGPATTTTTTTITTTGSVSPQTEGVETPTFTPLGSSPETVTSPLANPQQIFACSEDSCGRRRFSRRCDLNKHLKTHRKDLQCQHPSCGKCFSTEKDRKRHFSTVHQGEKPFVCDLCEGGKRFSRQDNLKDHKRRIHGA